MSTPIFIPGHLTTITIDAQDYTVTGNLVGLSSSKNTPRKPVFGAKASGVVGGQQSWNGNAAGHLATDEPLAALLTSYDKDDPVAFTIQIGDAAGATDGGQLSGNLIISSLEFTADAEGEWDYAFGFEVDGQPVYTAPTP